MKWFYYDNEIGEICKENISFKEFINKIKGSIIVVAIIIIITVVLNSFLLMNTQVPSISMEKTINAGDMIIGNRVAYKFNEPKRGDIIIFKGPDEMNVQYIKRIIGLPGEKLEIIKGDIYINDKKIDEHYIEYTSKDSYGPYNIPDNSYFVLGDNRDASRDSREWANTYVKKEYILAKAICSYWPHIKLLK